MRQLILVTGAARSGKSEWAEKLASRIGKPVIYLATAITHKDDLEWKARIEQHQQRRPKSWQTLEVPSDLAAAIEQAHPPYCLLIDSLGTWVANHLDRDPSSWERTLEQLLNCLECSGVDTIIVAEETGWGVVPAYESGRLFRDRLGSSIRQIGAIADVVYLVTGGYALNLSQLGEPLG